MIIKCFVVSITEYYGSTGTWEHILSSAFGDIQNSVIEVEEEDLPILQELASNLGLHVVRLSTDKEVQSLSKKFEQYKKLKSVEIAKKKEEDRKRAEAAAERAATRKQREIERARKLLKDAGVI